MTFAVSIRRRNSTITFNSAKANEQIEKRREEKKNEECVSKQIKRVQDCVDFARLRIAMNRCVCVCLNVCIFLFVYLRERYRSWAAFIVVVFVAFVIYFNTMKNH